MRHRTEPTEPIGASTTADPRPVPARSGPPQPSLIPRRMAARVLATQLVLAAVIGTAFLVCYAGLQRDPQPHGLPISVVGTRSADAVAAGLGSRAAVLPVRSAGAARKAVLRRTSIAGLDLGGSGGAVLTVAGANGLAENGAVEQLAAAVVRGRLRIVDAAPTLPFDPRGLASFYVALSGTAGSFILAQAMFALRLIVRLRSQLVTLAVFAVVLGGLLALLAGPVLQVVPVDWPPLAAVLALLSVAVSFTTRALIAWLQAYGIALATLLMTAVGLSTSGGILGQDLLPAPLGALGAILPPGSAFRAIVSLGYFHGAASALPLLVLGTWAVLGLGATLLHAARAAR